MATVKIVIDTSQSGDPGAAKNVASDLRDIRDAANDSGKSVDNAKSSFDQLGSTMQTLYFSSQVMGQAFSWVDQVVSGGEAAIRTSASLDALAGSKAPAMMDKMRDATHGAVDDLTLMRTESLLLSSGLATNADDMAHLARNANDLGISMQQLPKMIEQFAMSGRANAFADYGVPIEQLKEAYKALKKEGVDPTQAALEAFYQTTDPLATKLDPIVAKTDDWARAGTNIRNTFQGIGTWLAGEFNTAYDSVDAVAKDIKIIEDFKGNGGWGDQSHNIGPAGPQTISVSQGYQGLGGLMDFGFSGNGPAWIKTLQNDVGKSASLATNMSAPGSYQQQFAQDASGVAGLGRSMLVAEQEDVAGQKMAMAAEQHGKAAAMMHLAATINAETAQKLPQSIAEAFSIHPASGIGGQVGQGFQQDVDAQRQQLVKQYGANSSQVAQFDVTSQQALDHFNIATGQATQASTQFDAILKQVHTSAATGKISFDQESVALQAMAAAAESGKTSLSDIVALQKQIAGIEGDPAAGLDTGGFTGRGGRKSRPGTGDESDATGTGAAAKQVSALKQPADDAATSMNNLSKSADTATKSVAATGPAGLQAGSQVAAGAAIASFGLAGANAIASVYLGTLQQIRALGG